MTGAADSYCLRCNRRAVQQAIAKSAIVAGVKAAPETAAFSRRRFHHSRIWRIHQCHRTVVQCHAGRTRVYDRDPSICAGAGGGGRLKSEAGKC